jgi:hypothetical protein
VPLPPSPLFDRNRDANIASNGLLFLLETPSLSIVAESAFGGDAVVAERAGDPASSKFPPAVKYNLSPNISA